MIWDCILFCTFLSSVLKQNIPVWLRYEIPTGQFRTIEIGNNDVQLPMRPRDMRALVLRFNKYIQFILMILILLYTVTSHGRCKVTTIIAKSGETPDMMICYHLPHIKHMHWCLFRSYLTLNLISYKMMLTLYMSVMYYDISITCFISFLACDIVNLDC